MGEAELRAEEPGLLVRALRQLAAAEAAGEAEVVADQRARAGLAADGARVEHGRPQPLRGAVDRRAQPGGAGADDDEIGLVRVELGRETERPGQLGGSRIGQDLAVGERHRRGVTVAGDRPVRDAEARQARAELVRAGGACVGDDDRARRPLAAQALRLLQQLADRPVEDLVAPPRRCDHVEVDPAARHAAEDELADAASAPAEPGDQEAAPRRREAAAHPGEQVGSLLPGREGEGDVVAVRLRLVEDALRARRSCRSGACSRSRSAARAPPRSGRARPGRRRRPRAAAFGRGSSRGASSAHPTAASLEHRADDLREADHRDGLVLADGTVVELSEEARHLVRPPDLGVVVLDLAR